MVSDWFDVIRRQGEESQKRQNERLVAMQAGLQERVEWIQKLPSNELLAHYDGYICQRGVHDRRERELWAVLERAAKEELLNRLSRPKYNLARK